MIFITLSRWESSVSDGMSSMEFGTGRRDESMLLGPSIMRRVAQLLLGLRNHHASQRCIYSLHFTSLRVKPDSNRARASRGGRGL